MESLTSRFGCIVVSCGVILALSGCGGTSVADDAVAAVDVSLQDGIAETGAEPLAGMRAAIDQILVSQQGAIDQTLGDDTSLDILPAEPDEETRRVHAFSTIICAVTDVTFWERYFAGDTSQRTLQQKRDAYFVTLGFASEYDALAAIELSREDTAFQERVQTDVGAQCAETFASSGASFGEIFADPLVEDLES